MNATNNKTKISKVVSKWSCPETVNLKPVTSICAICIIQSNLFKWPPL